MMVVIKSIRQGSVIVDFDIVTNSNFSLDTTVIQKTFIEALNSSALGVDLNQTSVTEADACKDGSSSCSENATCTAYNGTYTCACKSGFTDLSPDVPGRDCKVKIITTMAAPTNSTSVSNPTKPATVTVTPATVTSSFNPAMTTGTDKCQLKCSSLAQCIANPGGYKCICYDGLIDQNPSNPGRLCQDPVDCFNGGSDLCSLGNNCLKSKSVCSRQNVYKCTVVLQSWKFNPVLYNPESDASIALSLNITITIVNKMRSILSDNTFDLTIVGFQKGSVKVYLVSGFDGRNGSDDSTFQTALQDVVQQNLDSTASVVTEKIPSAPADGGGWRVAVIVIGVLFGFILLVGVIFVIFFTARRTVKKCAKYPVQQVGRIRNLVPFGNNGSFLYRDV
nr:PREDICTED: uncharacterized protein LOC107076670 [Lepisosteus oculatus]